MARRDEVRGVGFGIGEDRLSAAMAAALVAANILGGGLLALLKALDVPPLVASPAEPGPVVAGPARDGAAPVAVRVAPEAWRR